MSNCIFSFIFLSNKICPRRFPPRGQRDFECCPDRSMHHKLTFHEKFTFKIAVPKMVEKWSHFRDALSPNFLRAPIVNAAYQKQIALPCNKSRGEKSLYSADRIHVSSLRASAICTQVPPSFLNPFPSPASYDAAVNRTGTRVPGPACR